MKPAMGELLHTLGCKEEGKVEMTSARDKPGNLI